jgi:hypothetical protein
MILLSEVPSRRTLAIYLILVWMAINAFLMIPEIGVFYDYTYLMELVLWIASIVGLWLMKKWGAALTVVILCFSLGTSVSTFLLAYNLSLLLHSISLMNALRIVLNTVGTFYVFNSIFTNKFS